MPHNELPIFYGREPTIEEQAEDVVEEYLLAQVGGKEGFFTARSAAYGCGCNTCIRTFNSWIDFLAGEHQGEFDQYKLPLRGKEYHNPDSWWGINYEGSV